MAGTITVMGGGIFGLAAAWACLQRGATVRLIEARRIGSGASGGLVGALAPHAPDGRSVLRQLQLEALATAGDWWAEIARSGGADPGYARVGRVQPIADAAGVERARKRQAGAAALWPDGFVWQVTAASRAPGIPVAAGAGQVVHDTLSARLNPRRAVAALAAALRAGGAEILESAGTDAAPGADAGPVIWATGWEGLGALPAAGRGGVKGQALLLAMETPPQTPIITAPGLYIVPHDDGTVAVGSTSEPDFTLPDTTDAQLDALHARALAICPALAGAPVVERWAGVRPRAAGSGPVAGPWPGRPGHFIANGGGGIGFALAPAVAGMLADLVVCGQDAIPEAFRPENRPWRTG